MDNILNIPTQVLIDVVHPTNKWELVSIRNSQINQLIIRKGNYFYNLNNISLFKNFNFSIRPYNESSICLGEFKPLFIDMMYLSLLPISLNGNEFILNIRTKIVYIKPKNITLMLSKNTEYNFETIKNYYYGGIFNQYLHCENHTGKLFIETIPSKNKTSNSVIVPEKPIKEIPNNFNNNFNKKLNYDQVQLNNSLLGDKLLISNNYVTNKPLMINVSQNGNVLEVNKIIFIIPYLEKHDNNIQQLYNSLRSIIYNVDNKEIYLITNKESFELDPEFINHIQLIRYPNYVGSLGFENRLNNLMKNGYDLAYFYNYIINNLVKSECYIIWKYNWILTDKWNINEANVSFPIYNYYKYKEKEFKSKTFVNGILADSKKRFNTTPDLMNIYLPNINMLTNLIIPIKCVYGELDYENVKNKITYDENRELKDFYENIMKDQIPDYIEKS